QSSGAIQLRDEEDDKEPNSPPSPPVPTSKRETIASAGPVKFMKGTLTSIDCGTAPSAVLTVASGITAWKLTVADVNHVVLLGADKFSCSWSKQKVAVNYVETGAGVGRVISLEIQ